MSVAISRASFSGKLFSGFYSSFTINSMASMNVGHSILLRFKTYGMSLNSPFAMSMQSEKGTVKIRFQLFALTVNPARFKQRPPDVFFFLHITIPNNFDCFYKIRFKENSLLIMSYLLKSVRFSVLAVMFVQSVLGRPTTWKRDNTVHEQTYKTIMTDTREENNNNNIPIQKDSYTALRKVITATTKEFSCNNMLQ